MESQSHSLMSRYATMLVIGADEKIKGLILQTAKSYYSEVYFTNDQNDLVGTTPDYTLILIIAPPPDVKDDERPGFIKLVKTLKPRSFIAIFEDSQITSVHKEKLRAAGADAICSSEKFLSTGRLEWLLIIAQGFEVFKIPKLRLHLGDLLPFSLYHRMPLNQKTFLLLAKNKAVEANELRKIESSLEFCAYQSEIAEVYKHYEKSSDLTDESVRGYLQVAVCFYHSICQQFLMKLLEPNSKLSELEVGTFIRLLNSLLKSILVRMSSVQDSWSDVYNTLGEQKSYFANFSKRSLLSAHLGLISGINEPGEIALASLLSEVGLLSIPRESLNIYLEEWPASLAMGHRPYEAHIGLSIQAILGLPSVSSEKLQALIRSSRERFDKKGYPLRANPEDISEASAILQFVALVDLLYCRNNKISPIGIDEIMRQEILREETNPLMFSKDFTAKVKALF